MEGIRQPIESALSARIVGDVIELAGELDLATVPHFVACAELLPLSDVVVDVTELHFMDCRGLAAILRAAERSRQAGYSLSVRGASGIVARVFLLAGLEALLQDGETSPVNSTQECLNGRHDGCPPASGRRGEPTPGPVA